MTPSVRLYQGVTGTQPDERDSMFIGCANRMGRAIAFALGGALLVAATSRAQAGTFIHADEQPAHAALAAYQAYGNVGLLTAHLADGTTSVASGVVIGNQYLITAAHAVDRAADVSFDINGQTYTGRRWRTHPAWTGENFQSGVDFAIIKIQGVIPSVTPAKLWRKGKEVGKVGVIVGYGATGTGDTGATSPTGVKHAGRNRIDATSGFNSRMIQIDLDPEPGTAPAVALLASAGRTFNATIDTPVPLEYLSARGDSGGGLFINGRLAGITSHLLAPDGDPNASFGDIARFTRITPWTKVIARIIRELETGKNTSVVGMPGQPILVDPLLFPAHATSSLTLAHDGALPTPEPAAALLILLSAPALLGRRRSA
jgi:hypothetical protein